MTLSFAKLLFTNKNFWGSSCGKKSLNMHLFEHLFLWIFQPMQGDISVLKAELSQFLTRWKSLCIVTVFLNTMESSEIRTNLMQQTMKKMIIK